MTTTQDTDALVGLEVAMLDPRELVAHPRNVRTDLGDLAGLAASIAAQGLIEPITVAPVTDDHFLIVAGHRRAAAAIEAGLERVPCIVRRDLPVDGDAAQAAHVGTMLSENLHRASLSAVEEARGVQAMLDLGVPISKVAKSTGLAQKRVKKALGVARLDDSTAAAVAKRQLDLDQAAAVAQYADDHDTTARLLEAAERGPGNFAHELERAKQDRDRARRLEGKRKELVDAGRTVVDAAHWNGTKNRTLESLAGSKPGSTLTAAEHADCPGSAVAVYARWSTEPQVNEVCTDIKKYGHPDRYTGDSGSVKAKPETEEEKEAARAERREVLENNKAMAAANATRRAWLKEFLARRTAPPAVLRFAVEEIALSPDAVHGWLSGSYTQDSEDSIKALGLVRPSRWRQTDLSLTSGEQVPDGRLPLQLFAHIAAAVDGTVPKDAWHWKDTDRKRLVRWLRFLVELGYTLSDVERGIVDREPSAAAATAEAACPGCGEAFDALEPVEDTGLCRVCAAGGDEIDPDGPENWVDGDDAGGDA